MPWWRVGEHQHNKPMIKNITKTLAVAAAVGALCATSAQASLYTESAGNTGPNVTAPGASGVIEFTYQFSNATGSYAPVASPVWTSSLDPANINPGYGQGLVGNPGIFSAGPSLGAGTTLSIGAGVTYSIGTVYTLFVDYTIAPGALIGSSSSIEVDIGVKDPDGNYKWIQQDTTITVGAVPEPTTAVAGGLALILAGLPAIRFARSRKSS